MQGQRIVLASRPGPSGPGVENFHLEAFSPSPAKEGEVLLETLFLSLDPYMRARMYDGGNYKASVGIGEVMIGGTVSRVLESREASLAVGDIVESRHGWQTHATVPGSGLRKIDPDLAPISTALGVLGMPGQTGYGGMLRYGMPKPGETVLVSAASGGVGSVAAQVARIKGARVVGIAGGAAKCSWLTEELGLVAAVDHRAENFAENLAAVCPDGIDVYFDNVGGEIFADTIPLLNAGARIPICGTISVDRHQPSPLGRDRMYDLHATILVKQLTLNGFIFDNLLDMTHAFRRDMVQWIASGEVKYREDVVSGLDAAPSAFLGLFRGENFGKLIVRVAGV
ncbi:NADP-dependent oxidoreductase [Rhizobium sp. L1K21]|uniref:NADP-dependent oxidoreductase n=1 Tax=Rhizobium sp. L1K21 TaxID=2954933 RepID=UPI002092F708|nr:NADP-dependent oxidoreductase [Rhizobium sp. L1K21]MCO6188414.1 NADP-dependent oxidoreductase [Rhizobium sp. L1K21]